MTRRRPLTCYPHSCSLHTQCDALGTLLHVTPQLRDARVAPVGGRTSALFPVRSGAGRGLSLALGLGGGQDHAWRHCPAPRASRLREVERPCALLSDDVSSRLRPVILAVCISLLSLGRLNRVPVQGDLVSTGEGPAWQLRVSGFKLELMQKQLLTFRVRLWPPDPRRQSYVVSSFYFFTS